MTRVNESDEPAEVEALYDAFAPALYRYAWSLLGGGADPARATAPLHAGSAPQDTGDPVAEAVHDALVAGVVLERERTDPADRGPWLYALTRSACQRRGFAHTCPYTRLATVPAEAPVARMFSRLPASHRELVELNLRHALSNGAVARVLGLDDQICGELSRSAIRRAAEGLEGIDPHQRPLALGEEDPATTGWRTKVHQVSSALSLLRPPGPPPALRAQIVLTSTDPALAEERDRIAATMHPLTSDGYPLHRSRLTRPVEEEAAAPAEPVVEPLPRALPGDRLTTRDHPVRTETVTRLAGPDDSAHGTDEEGTTRRRWPLPAVSGVATVVMAVALWSWASAVGGPTAVIGTGPADTRPSPSTEVEAVSTASDGKPAAGPVDRTTQAPGTVTTQDTADQAPTEGASDPSPSAQEEPRAPERDGEQGGSTEPTAPATPSESPSDEPPEGAGDGAGEGDEGEIPSDDPGGGLLTGLWEFLAGGG
ncbi:sigma-70 family RNA polymerase sigma factor [Nocardiopsis sp. YSL2]|uniref:sigma-70 family RNA polymerase sigma factor n=1 Tax=Nocardiopsis sp. YSL2 TaxID=2939492 RepID=UPI0026F41920|nr:sigma-70 family RNA polymerase sigma factor [Nocardiopsis sp. YSL2]